jgi:hypothetical protein
VHITKKSIEPYRGCGQSKPTVLLNFRKRHRQKNRETQRGKQRDKGTRIHATIGIKNRRVPEQVAGIDKEKM